MIVQRIFSSALSVVGLLLAGCGSPTGALNQTVEQTYQIEPTASIRIENGDGTIRIYGAAITELRVIAIKRAYTAARLDEIAVKISAQPNSVSIQTTVPPKSRWSISDRSGTVDYVIVAPEKANLERVELINGEVLVEGMRSKESHVHVSMGRLSAHNCFSNLFLGIDTGPLALIYDWWEPEKFSVEAKVAKGRALASIPGDASFHLTAEAPNGGISNEFTAQREGGGRRNKIDSVIGAAPNADFVIRVMEGNVRITKAYR